MGKNRFFILLMILVSFLNAQSDFLVEQMRFERVRTSINEKQEIIESKLKSNNLELDDFHILFTAYKNERTLEVYAKKVNEQVYKIIDTFKICAFSGQLGPKRREGDGQVPEGFYHINRFNPTSNFYLSLGLNYPNLSDRRKSNAKNLGGDIFIHGNCVTIGCLPMTDNFIKEIYLLAVYAKKNGQNRIPVYIFPFKMTDQNMTTYKSKFEDNKELILFWENLKIGYDKFIKESRELIIKVKTNGDYTY